MKKYFILPAVLIGLSFTYFQKNNFSGTWNVVDSYRIEPINLQNPALRELVKKKIVEQKSQIILSDQDIMIKQNEVVTDKSKVKDLKKITNDSIVFKFDNHMASFKLKNEKSGVITVDKTAVFVVEK
ncbi:hypothetical protein [uncultured Chryseobacterium sp.]|uniref:hypothetical protein n=1 Tax=uncultured Chryseobacterium sp. TaxID=259322 RepID=UPI0025EA79D2|nr:hypothetical protein [uncultured Chryseobacterium sp.]